MFQVFASVLRNLSWKADKSSQAALRGSGSVSALARAAMQYTGEQQQESTLKNVLSALWNLSAHTGQDNKRQLCDEPGWLAFLARLLRFDPQSDMSARRVSILEVVLFVYWM